MMDPAWRQHLAALGRFNAWEAEQRRGKPGDYAAALAWLSEAAEMAGRIDPDEDPQTRRDRHLREILDLRASLARANPGA